MGSICASQTQEQRWQAHCAAAELARGLGAILHACSLYKIPQGCVCHVVMLRLISAQTLLAQLEKQASDVATSAAAATQRRRELERQQDELKKNLKVGKSLCVLCGPALLLAQLQAPLQDCCCYDCCCRCCLEQQQDC